MNIKKRAVLTTLLIVLLLVADQALKIWIKTSMRIDEAIMVCGEWFQLRFVENPGFAFGMELGQDWGKLALSLFRIVLSGGIAWYIVKLIRQKAPVGVIIGFSLIFAGAVGNIIDSAFYGLIFTESTPLTVAQWGGGYASFLHGRVVDMFYFTLFQWNSCPEWLSFLVDRNHYFFGAIFNLADAYISVAVVYLFIFQYKFFGEDKSGDSKVSRI